MRRIAGILLALSLAMPAALAANTAPQPLSSLLPGPGKTAGVDLANECMSGSILPVANGGTGISSGSATNGQLLIGKTSDHSLNLATLTGTANQVVVTNGAGSITLSTPQSIGTGSSPTFAGLTLSSPLTVANGGTGIATTPSNGYVPIGNGTNYTAAALTAGFGTSITNGAGSITVASDPVTGTAVLSSGTSGAIVNASVTTNSIIMVTYKGTLVAAGKLSVTPGAGSFTIDSDSGTDASTVMYHIVKY